MSLIFVIPIHIKYSISKILNHYLGLIEVMNGEIPAFQWHGWFCSVAWSCCGTWNSSCVVVAGPALAGPALARPALVGRHAKYARRQAPRSFFPALTKISAGTPVSCRCNRNKLPSSSLHPPFLQLKTQFWDFHEKIFNFEISVRKDSILRFPWKKTQFLYFYEKRFKFEIPMIKDSVLRFP